ncbi:MAG TPA: hypothetical protein VF788_14460 [Pseudonocardiaceae bacterium]|jgi:hypothetical protein
MSYTPRRSPRGQGIALIVLGLLLLVTGVMLPYRLAGIPAIFVLGCLILFAGIAVAIFGDAPPGRLSAGMEQRIRRRFEDDRSLNGSDQPRVGSPMMNIVLAVVASIILTVIISAANQFISAQPTQSGWADVTVTGCTIKTELGTTTANADVRIVNHTSHPASYLVTVGLNNAHGDRIGVATAASNDLPSGRTVTVTGMGTTNTPSAPAGRCELADVMRLP